MFTDADIKQPRHIPILPETNFTTHCFAEMCFFLNSKPLTLRGTFHFFYLPLYMCFPLALYILFRLICRLCWRLIGSNVADENLLLENTCQAYRTQKYLYNLVNMYTEKMLVYVKCKLIGLYSFVLHRCSKLYWKQENWRDTRFKEKVRFLGDYVIIHMLQLLQQNHTLSQAFTSGPCVDKRLQ